MVHENLWLAQHFYIFVALKHSKTVINNKKIKKIEFFVFLFLFVFFVVFVLISLKELIRTVLI